MGQEDWVSRVVTSQLLCLSTIVGFQDSQHVVADVIENPVIADHLTTKWITVVVDHPAGLR